MTVVLLDLAASAIRRYLVAGTPPPPALDPAIRAAAHAALGDAGRATSWSPPGHRHQT